MNKAQIGSISTGSLRTEDLLEAFADELEYLIGKKATGPYAALIAEARDCDPDSDDALEIVTELQDALNEHAPPFCWFGAHDGDGADFGFWPCFSNIEELPKVSDTSELESLDADISEAAHVNDHGNVSVYVRDGNDWKAVLEIV